MNDELKFTSGTGFFCEIPILQIKVLFTNNHVLDQDFLDNEKKLIYIIDIENKEVEKEMNLELKRIKYTNIELDFTIIEILEEDKIENYLEIDKYINSKNYKDEHVLSLQFPGGKKLKISPGKILAKKKNKFLYTLGTDKGSSGSPIILVDNSKVIGLHKAGYGKNKKNKINVGIPMNLIINTIYKKINIKAKLLEDINNYINKLADLFEGKIFNFKINVLGGRLRIILAGDMGVGKRTILNCILGENIISTGNEINYGIRRIIIQYQDTNDFYLYKTNLIKKENQIKDDFFENEKDFEVKGINNIRAYLNDKNKESFLEDNEAPYFTIKGKLKIFNFIKLDSEIINRIDFILLTNHQKMGNIENNIIEYTDGIIWVYSPTEIYDYEAMNRIQSFYLRYKSRINIFTRQNFIKNNLFVINKSDLLNKDKNEKDKIEKSLFKIISYLEGNLTNSDDINISFFSGNVFVRFLEKYNDYIDNLENEPTFFLEKKFKELKEFNENVDENILFEDFFLEELNQIKKDFNLNFKKQTDIPEKFKQNLNDSINKICKINNIEIEDIKINKIISKLYNINQQLKNNDFSNKNFSSSFLDKLKTVILNSFEGQNLKSRILKIISLCDEFLSRNIMDENKITSENPKFELMKKNYTIIKNEIMNRLNEYMK